MKKIDPEKIINSKLWIPPLRECEFYNKTDSWFDMDMMNCNQPCKVKLARTITIRSKPIHLYPTVKQRKILLEWNEIYRQVYNLTVGYLKTNKIESFITIRKIIDGIISTNRNLTDSCKKFGIPKHTRDNAIKDCLKAYKTAFANLRNKNIRFFKLRYKKKSHHLSSIVIEPALFSKTKNGFAIKVLKEMNSEYKLTDITKECRLCYNARTGIFVLRVPYEKVTNQWIQSRNTCALDPGMRTFQTGYSPNNQGFKVCTDETNKQIYDLIKRIENVNKDNPRHKKFLNRIRERIQNKVKDMHYKLCLYLCKTYDRILIGNMSTKSIISKDLHLNKNTKKYCLALSHYLFKQRLKHKAEEYGRIIEIVDESYTTKTCGSCAELNDNVGSNKVFRCDKCNFTIDRDFNGSRNIYIKNM
jgi:putative transposase